MAPASKADKKAALDVASWMFNVVTSVGIIIVNKALMATYGYSFGKYIGVFYSTLIIVCIYSFVNATISFIEQAVVETVTLTTM